jgi:hypothetical protein
MPTSLRCVVIAQLSVRPSRLYDKIAITAFGKSGTSNCRKRILDILVCYFYAQWRWIFSHGGSLVDGEQADHGGHFWGRFSFLFSRMGHFLLETKTWTINGRTPRSKATPVEPLGSIRTP